MFWGSVYLNKIKRGVCGAPSNRKNSPDINGSFSQICTYFIYACIINVKIKKNVKIKEE
jgi:hypothetical protein